MKARGYCQIDVLPQLWGRPLDEVAQGFIYAQRPSSVRVCYKDCLLDSERWRVTVWINFESVIQKITQEVEVELPEGFRHGSDMLRSLHKKLAAALDIIAPVPQVYIGGTQESPGMLLDHEASGTMAVLLDIRERLKKLESSP
jgi:hypothetical protein